MRQYHKSRHQTDATHRGGNVNYSVASLVLVTVPMIFALIRDIGKQSPMIAATLFIAQQFVLFLIAIFSLFIKDFS